MNLAQALLHCRPGARWDLTGTEYAGLEWRDETQTKPTPDELQAAWDQLNAPKPPDPIVVKKAYFFLALGPDDQVLLANAIASMPEGVDKETAKTLYKHETHFSSAHPMIEYFRVKLGKTTTQLAAIFSKAKQLEQSQIVK